MAVGVSVGISTVAVSVGVSVDVGVSVGISTVAVSVGVPVSVGVWVAVPVGVGVGVWVGVPVAVGVLVGAKVPVAVGVAVGGKVAVGVGVSVAGNSVGVLLETTVGKDWVGVGSRVAVGEPITRVAIGMDGPSAEVGRGVWAVEGRVGLGKIMTNRVAVGDSSRGGAELRVKNPRQ